jgi:glycosyltransferase involved in cell wall biosynthesis
MTPIFSIVIPTANRPELLRHCLQALSESRGIDFEIIVSDNSNDLKLRNQNIEVLQYFKKRVPVTLVYPLKELSPPEHFQYALPFAKGKYIAYLTDKMLIRSDTLASASWAFEHYKADIVNWQYKIFRYDKFQNSKFQTKFLLERSSIRPNSSFLYDPERALRIKAAQTVNRNLQSRKVYVQGKIVFGAYRKELIESILGRSGSLFLGATHDYSAMVQALSIANVCVQLNGVGVDFASLPVNESLGTLTYFSSPAALKYYMSFSDPQIILDNLLVPGLWASQHNMVAHDYLKFLHIYGKESYLNRNKWLAAINEDLNLSNRVWKNHEEQLEQVNLFTNYLKKNRHKTYSKINLRFWNKLSVGELRRIVRWFKVLIENLYLKFK